MTQAKSLSVIIPVYNEAENLDVLFQRLQVFEKEGVECLLVDGGSQDATVDLVKQAGFKLSQSEKGRGQQLQQGVKDSQGDYLLFLHADTYFKQSPVEEIRRVLGGKDYAMGAFRLQFTSHHPLAYWIAWGSHWRLKHRQIAFGDQGMFMTRDFYQQMGGFRSLALMEDYDFSLRVKKAGQPIYASQQKIYTSARRFEKNGYLKTLKTMQTCQHLFRQGEDVEKIQALYRQDKH